jgi:hypothetical protein
MEAPSEVDLNRQDCLLLAAGLGQDLAIGTDGEASAQIAPPLLFTHMIRGKNGDPVLGRSCPGDEVRIQSRRRRPRRREQNGLGTREGEDTGRFGEAQVVADEHAQPSQRGFIDGGR